jgi:hypothetical protein
MGGYYPISQKARRANLSDIQLFDLKTHLKKRYNMTLEDYNTLFIKQEGKCAICKKHQINFSRRLAVDHCHKTSRVRGLLCPKCNWRVGFLETTDLILYQKYLDSFYGEI